MEEKVKDDINENKDNTSTIASSEAATPIEDYEPEKWEMTTLEKASIPIDTKDDSIIVNSNFILSQNSDDAQMEKVIENAVELGGCQQLEQKSNIVDIKREIEGGPNALNEENFENKPSKEQQQTDLLQEDLPPLVDLKSDLQNMPELRVSDEELNKNHESIFPKKDAQDLLDVALTLRESPKEETIIENKAEQVQKEDFIEEEKETKMISEDKPEDVPNKLPTNNDSTTEEVIKDSNVVKENEKIDSTKVEPTNNKNDIPTVDDEANKLNEQDNIDSDNKTSHQKSTIDQGANDSLKEISGNHNDEQQKDIVIENDGEKKEQEETHSNKIEKDLSEKEEKHEIQKNTIVCEPKADVQPMEEDLKKAPEIDRSARKRGRPPRFSQYKNPVLKTVAKEETTDSEKSEIPIQEKEPKTKMGSDKDTDSRVEKKSANAEEIAMDVDKSDEKRTDHEEKRNRPIRASRGVTKKPEPEVQFEEPPKKIKPIDIDDEVVTEEAPTSNSSRLSRKAASLATRTTTINITFDERVTNSNYKCYKSGDFSSEFKCSACKNYTTTRINNMVYHTKQCKAIIDAFGKEVERYKLELATPKKHRNSQKYSK